MNLRLADILPLIDTKNQTLEIYDSNQDLWCSYPEDEEAVSKLSNYYVDEIGAFSELLYAVLRINLSNKS